MNKIFQRLTLGILIFSFLIPSITLGETAVPSYDLEVLDVSYSSKDGSPTKVKVKNNGPESYTGRSYIHFYFLNNEWNNLHQSVGALEYGTDYFANKNLADVTIAPGQTHEVELRDPFRFRHREAVKAKVEVSEQDGNTSNNKLRISDIPMPDLYPRYIYAERYAPWDTYNTHSYTINFQIANGGLAGYKSGTSLREPIILTEITYTDGTKVSRGFDIGLDLRTDIPAGSVIQQQRSISVDKNKTLKDIVISIDYQNNVIFESNETNNIATVPFTTTPPTLPDFMANGNQNAIEEFQNSVTENLNLPNQALANPLVPCSLKSKGQSLKDKLKNATTFNKEKKIKNKLKQAALKVNAVNKNESKVKPDCIELELKGYESLQKSILKDINNLNKKDHKKAEELSSLTFKEGANHLKVLNVVLKDNDSDDLEKYFTKFEKDYAGILTTLAKVLTDKSLMESTIRDSFETSDSPQASLFSIGLLNELENYLKQYADLFNTLEKENAIKANADLAGFDLAQSEELTSYFEEIKEEVNKEEDTPETENAEKTEEANDNVLEEYTQEEEISSSVYDECLSAEEMEQIQEDRRVDYKLCQ